MQERGRVLRAPDPIFSARSNSPAPSAVSPRAGRRNAFPALGRLTPGGLVLRQTALRSTAPWLCALALPLAAAAAPPLGDPFLGDQWGLAAVNAPAAWALAPGPHATLVAVIDTGADWSHADLAANLWDGNLQHGASTAEPFGVFASVPVGPYSITMDDRGHGTLVAGVLAATPGNGVGVRGVADAPLMLVKVSGAGAPGTVTALANGLVWAVDHGARVASVSQTAGLPHPALDAAIAYAEARGVVVIAAAGNDGRATRHWPAAYPTVVSVAASTILDDVWPHSSFGKVDLAAPGEGILSTALGNQFTRADGTSLATPHAAGVAALVLAVAPDLTAREVRAVLNETARDVLAPGFDARTGHGVVDAGAAVARALELAEVSR